ncbi:MAG: flavin reductase family protein [Bacteroidota bacterium]
MIIDTSQSSPRDVYQMLSSCVIPRPIAWVTTRSAAGIINTAPFSFFNIVSADPPTVMIAVGRHAGGRKDTAQNIHETKEFGISLVTESLAAAMNTTSASFPSSVNEAERAGIRLQPGRHIASPLVADSPVKLECTLSHWVELGKSPTDVIFGKVILMDINDDVLESGKIAANKLKAIGRLGGNQYCTTADIFELERPR